MKKLLALTPVLLIAAMPLAACSKQDGDANNSATSYELLNGEGSADANGAADDILNSDASLDNAAVDNGAAPSSNAL